ncbi:ABC transporter ATP-binding protein [Saccharopolyspora sp. NPDC000995]
MAGGGDRVLRSVVGQDRGATALLVLTALLTATTGLLLPSALAGAVDAVITGDGGPARVMWLVSLVSIHILGEVMGVALTARLTASATARLRVRLVAGLIRGGYRSGLANGDAVSRISSDCTGAGQITANVVQLGTALVLSAGAVTALVLLDWRIAVVFLCATPLAVLLARSHLRHTATDLLAYQESSSELGARLFDAVGGLRTIAAAGVADQETARVLRPLPKLSAAGAGVWRTQARMMWRAGLLLPCVQVAVLGTAGAGVLTGDISVGDVLAALVYTTLGLGLVRQMPLFTALARARSCATRIAEVVDGDPEPAPHRLPPHGPGRLEVSGVGVDGALFDVDLVVSGGDTVAVVGRSGSGKSVLAELLGGLRRPDRGDVLLDGLATHLVARSAIGYGFERPTLLGDTVGAAVAYGTGADTDDVRSACRMADVHDLINRLPARYRTPLAQAPLSGGEAQRIGLARALVRRPRLLVLDDATASLDTVTEARVEAAISTALPDLTRIVVTHRAGTARRADAVLWLEDGRVRAVAPHDFLWIDPAYRAVFTEEDQQ